VRRRPTATIIATSATTATSAGNVENVGNDAKIAVMRPARQLLLGLQR
jgi:hypothetical protein